MQNCTEPNERWVDEGETATAASVWKVKKKVKDFTSCTRKLFYVLTFLGVFGLFSPGERDQIFGLPFGAPLPPRVRPMVQERVRVPGQG